MIIFGVIVLLPIFVIAEKSVTLQELTHGNHLFSSKVYNELVKENSGNFLVSPFSAETILALTQLGSGGTTAQELRKVLHLPKGVKGNTIKAFQMILKNFNDKSKDYQLLTANKIYVSNEFNVKKYFYQMANNVFKTETENVNFKDGTNTLNSINKWVENHTNSKITNIVSPGSLDPEDKLLLVNTLYFQGQWVTDFDKSMTMKIPFFTNNSFHEVDTMTINSEFLFYDSPELNAKFLNMPYLGGDVSMTIALPKEKDGLAYLEKQMEKVFNVSKFREEIVNVTLPKFKIQTEIKFLPILKELGVKSAFNPTKADLSLIAGSNGELFINNVIQKTFIEVTESGTEAAAATTISLSNRFGTIADDSQLKSFIADHPFLFYIKVDDVILFVGRVIDPKV